MIKVWGKVIDNETRCVHWHTDLDVMAIKFKCCKGFYSCYSCHKETTNHPTIKYDLSIQDDRDVQTILCGKCFGAMTFSEYVSDVRCINCDTAFNPGCKLHYNLYFENFQNSNQECHV